MRLVTRPLRNEAGGHSPNGAPPFEASGGRIAVVAHELRGPLAAILYALEVIPGEPGSAAGRARAVAVRQARQAARVVDDLFDLSAGSLGKLAVRPEPVVLGDVVAAAVEATGHLVASRRHRLTVTLPADPVTLVADPARLEQVLANLLTNAAKFTDPGGQIAVSAEAGGGWAEVRVRDDGRGIPPHLLPRLFTPFAQGVVPGGERPAGLGLGLALVETLVALHGGTVAATSGGPGRGSEFAVRLPTGPRPQDPRSCPSCRPRSLITPAPNHHPEN